MKDLDKKWLLVGIVIALINPVFSGIVLGIAYLTDGKLKREGQIVLALSLIWAILIALWKQLRAV